VASHLSGAIARLSIEVLGCSSNLMRQTLDLSFGIAHSTAEAFLHFATNVSRFAVNPILVHRYLLNRPSTATSQTSVGSQRTTTGKARFGAAVFKPSDPRGTGERK
jgi:hypothetical protein